MSNADANAAPSTAAPTVKMPIMPLLLCVVAAVVLAVGGSAGVMYAMAKSGRLHGAAVGGPATVEAAASAPAAAVPTQSLTMEPLLANLADADGHAYLRLGVVLQVEESGKKDKDKEKEVKGAVSPLIAPLRDSVLDVLGREQSAALLAEDGKEKLKHELMERFAKQNADAKVREIYFTDFLVQR